MAPWLSILIPVYNVEKYIEECLLSVTKQWLPGVEIILLNDCSQDASVNLIEQFASQSDVSLRLLSHEKNGGLSAARNTLMKAATGNYIWFLDSDDCLSDGAVRALKNIIEKENPDLVMCDYSVWRPDIANVARQEVHTTGFSGESGSIKIDKNNLFQGLYAKGKLHSWSKIARRDLWLQVAFPEGKYFEDMATTPRLALLVDRYIYIDEPWVKYRQREGSILAVPTLQKINDMVDGNAGVLRDWLNAYPALSTSAQFTFIKYCVKVYFFSRRQLRKLSLDRREYFSVYRTALLSHTQTSLFGLAIWYLKRGEVFRLLKLLVKC